MSLRHIAVLLLILSATIPISSAAVTSFDITPTSPIQGDTISIGIIATPGEQVPVTITFVKELTVSGGKYELSLSGVNVPQTPNNFIVRTEGVQNLNVAVQILFWITKSDIANGGVAIVSQSGVPPGNYEVKISGDALSGTNSVTLRITASTTVTCDADGHYTFNYDTSAIPPGSFVVNVGGLTQSGLLAARGGGGGGGGGGSGINKPPFVTAVVPSIAFLGVELSFDGSGSNDTDGKIVSWAWTFGDGSTASGMIVTHIFEATGTYQVSLTVKDDAGASASTGWMIKVERLPNELPVAQTGSDRRVYIDRNVDFDGSSSIDPDGLIVSYSWDFGDGSMGTGVHVSHSYNKAGVYDVSLTVADSDGAFDSSTLKVTVEVPPLTPSIEKDWVLETGKSMVNSSEAGIPLKVVVNSTGPVTLTLFTYPSNPHPSIPLPLNDGGVFFDISVSNPDAIEWPIYIEAAYSGAAETLGLYYFDGESWLPCSVTGYDSVRDLIWAWMTRHEAAGSPLTIGAITEDTSVRVSNFSVYPPVIVSGDVVEVSMTLHNLGSILTVCPVVIKVGGVVKVKDNVTLSAGTIMVVKYNISTEAEGVYEVDASGLLGRFTVLPKPKPAEIVVESFDVSPINVFSGGSVVVSAKLRNLGEVSGSKQMEVSVNGLKAVSQSISLSGGGETMFTTSLILDTVGINTISLNGVLKTVTVFSVESENGDLYWDNYYFIIVVLAITIVAGYLLIRRRSQR